jgi:hypothetical protein
MDGPNWQRRAILAGGFVALVGWVKGFLHLLSLGKADLEFEAIPDLTPFRSLSNNGATTIGAAIFACSAVVDAVMVSWNAKLGAYRLEMRGKLLDVQQKAKPTVAAGLVSCESSLKLFAGGRIDLDRTKEEFLNPTGRYRPRA